MTGYCVIFDFDGVIADTEALHFAASREVLASHGITLDRARYYQKYLGYSDAMMAEAVAIDQGLFAPDADLAPFVREFIHTKGEAYQRLKASGALLYDGVTACIQQMAAAYPIGIASGAFRHEIEEILAGADLLAYFSAIVGAGETSRSKPHPDPYLEAARRLDAAPDRCVAIEDSMWGLDAARAAGMKTIAVTSSYPASQLHANHVVPYTRDVTPAVIEAMFDA